MTAAEIPNSNLPVTIQDTNTLYTLTTNKDNANTSTIDLLRRMIDLLRRMTGVNLWFLN
jgi:hypothetical protein